MKRLIWRTENVPYLDSSFTFTVMLIYMLQEAFKLPDAHLTTIVQIYLNCGISCSERTEVQHLTHVIIH